MSTEQEVVYHEGGYSTFRADVTDLCKEGGENLLVVACSNERKESVYPQSADFTFYGGLYRGVNIISVAVDAPADAISALSGKIGRLAGITAKTVYAPEDALQQGK